MTNAHSAQVPDRLDGLSHAQLEAIKADILAEIDRDHASAPDLVGPLAWVNAYLRAAKKADDKRFGRMRPAMRG